MNQTNINQNPNGNRVFLIIGFVVLIIFMVWLAVTLVRFIPGAFSSLATIADSLYSERPGTEITVVSSDSVINTEQSVSLTWTNLHRDGIYTFRYECAEGVSLAIRYPGNTITEVDCNEVIELDGMTTSLEVFATSDERRFTDVFYFIEFEETDESLVAYSTEGTFTVVNAKISQIQPEDDDRVVIIDEDEEEVTPSVPTTPTTPVVPEPKIVYTYAIPQSDPNGFSDLMVRYRAVGYLTSNNIFVPSGIIDNDARGAFQFEVINLGTKTSDDWNFTAKFTSGTEFESKDQNGLKPNERSVITVGFDDVGEAGVRNFGATVEIDGSDLLKNNNSFTWVVQVTN